MRSGWVIQSVHPNSMNNILNNIHAKQNWTDCISLTWLRELPLAVIFRTAKIVCVPFVSSRAHSDGRWARWACMSRLCSAVQKNLRDHRWHGYETRRITGSLVCPSPFSVNTPNPSPPPHAFAWCMRLKKKRTFYMGTLTTLTNRTNSSQVDGKHSQRDIDLLGGTFDLILYLPPALLSLFSRAKLWALAQGL